MKSGIIKMFRFGQGFAIIAPDIGGPDVFLHFSAITDPRIKERMCIGLPVLYEATENEKGWKATICKADISFTWMELPGELCAGNIIAVRDDRDGTVEVFMNGFDARKWMTTRRGMRV